MAGSWWLGVVVGIAAIAIVLGVLWAVTRRLNRRSGRSGWIQRSRLTCPKCGRTFDYEWAVGAALTAVRLGSRRYMACPLCHRWSTFNITETLLPPSA